MASLRTPRDDEGCLFATCERKYYQVPRSDPRIFIKRSLRPSELPFNRFGRLVVPFRPKDKIRNEAAAIEYVGRHTTVPVPEVIACFEDDGAAYLITRYVSGVAMSDLPPEHFARVVTTVDGYVEQLRACRREALCSFVGEPIFPLRLEESLRSPFEVRYRAHAAEGYPLCHGDLSAQNIMVDPDTLQVVAVLDWEFAGFYPSDLDARFYASPERSGDQQRDPEGLLRLQSMVRGLQVP